MRTLCRSFFRVTMLVLLTPMLFTSPCIVKIPISGKSIFTPAWSWSALALGGFAAKRN
jgi:hypothetical protein